MEDLIFKIFVLFSEFLLAVVEGLMISNGLDADNSILIVLLTYAAAFTINFLIFTGELKN